jgi:predicted RNase H-like nuclease (RuvC/YqgF family)
MAKVEVDDAVLDRFVGKRVMGFKKEIDSLSLQVIRYKSKIKKLEKELERYKAGAMSTDKEVIERIAKFSRAFVGELQRANWVDKYYECGEEHCADDED